MQTDSTAWILYNYALSLRTAPVSFRNEFRPHRFSRHDSAIAPVSNGSDSEYERILTDMNENEVYSIKDILTLLWNHAILIIVFSLLAATAGYSISKYYLPLKYASHITIYVQSYTDIKESAESIYNVNNINYSKQLVNTYIEVLKDDAVKMKSAFSSLITSITIHLQEISLSHPEIKFHLRQSENVSLFLLHRIRLLSR